MTGLFLPITLTFAAIIAVFMTYRGIRRGGARYYTLEREALLRRASLTLLGATLLFLAAIGFLVYEQQQMLLAESPPTESVEGSEVEIIEEPVADELNTLPPLPTDTPPPAPTASPTPRICRAVVEGTFDNGLTLRETPGGEEVDVLAEASILTVITAEEPVETNGFVWIKVRSLFGDEGWVASEYVTLGTGCE